MRTRRLRELALSCALVGALGCDASPEDSPLDAAAQPARDAGTDAALPFPPAVQLGADPLLGLPRGEPQRQRLCAREGDDLVRDVLCAAEPPRIDDLAALQAALGIDPEQAYSDQGFALTGATTSLATRSVSAINPRILFVQLEGNASELLALGFARGDQLVEAVVRDRQSKELRFYAFAYAQACNSESSGCSPGDLLTEAVEHDWTSFDAYDDRDLENTVLDCLPCHQPDGPGTPRILRMHEIDTPWTHWMGPLSYGGQALLDDYYAAKGDEPLAGVPGPMLRAAHAGLMAAFVRIGGSREQPNAFDGARIEAEVATYAAERGGNQPFDNSVPGQSATWRQAHERAMRGEAIPVPYHDVKVTDPDKLERVTEAYRAYRAGELPRDQLPDLRDVFPDDPQLLADLSFSTEPGLSGEGVLLAACAQCHNERLDPTLSRARFSVDLGRMSRTQKDLAIARIELPRDAPGAMPPPRLRDLSDEGKAKLLELLRK